MNLSDFGKKITADAGILQLMDDLGKALADEKPVAMFGGGNPAHIPKLTEQYKKSLAATLEDAKTLTAMLGNYDTPQGNAAFIRSVVDFLNRNCNLGISPRNVTITPG